MIGDGNLRALAVGALIGGVAAALVTTTVIHAHGGDGSLIHGCINANGGLRITGLPATETRTRVVPAARQRSTGVSRGQPVPQEHRVRPESQARPEASGRPGRLVRRLPRPTL